MKSSVAFVSGVCLCLAAIAHGQGTIRITFDGPPKQPPGTSSIVTNYYESGLSFRPIPPSHGFVRTGYGILQTPENGTAYLQAAVGDSLMFSSANVSIFDLVSVDLAEYSTVVPDMVTVHFIGYRPDGSTVMTDFKTDGIIDGSGPLADFQTFYFDKEWKGLNRVEIPTFGWSLDNLVVSVPEPAVSALLLLGALAFGAFKLRSGHKE